MSPPPPDNHPRPRGCVGGFDYSCTDLMAVAVDELDRAARTRGASDHDTSAQLAGQAEDESQARGGRVGLVQAEAWAAVLDHQSEAIIFIAQVDFDEISPAVCKGALHGMGEEFAQYERQRHGNIIRQTGRRAGEQYFDL